MRSRNADRSPDIPEWLVGGAGRTNRCDRRKRNRRRRPCRAGPARVTRVFPAGPPAAITLYTITPDLLLGWPRANRDDEREFPDEKIGALPEVGRITGRGTTANLEVVLALKPDLVLDIGIVNNTYISLADRAYLLRDGACVAEGEVKHVLTSEQLQELYGAPIERLVDATTGATAFLPG